MPNNNPRNVHAGKTRYEKSKYQEMINSQTSGFNETLVEKDKLFDSTFSPIKGEEKPPSPRKKSKKLTFVDWLYENKLNLFASLILVVVCGTVWSQNREMGVIQTKLESTIEKINKVETSDDKTNQEIDTIKSDLLDIREQILEFKFVTAK